MSAFSWLASSTVNAGQLSEHVPAPQALLPEQFDALLHYDRTRAVEPLDERDRQALRPRVDMEGRRLELQTVLAVLLIGLAHVRPHIEQRLIRGEERRQ